LAIFQFHLTNGFLDPNVAGGAEACSWHARLSGWEVGGGVEFVLSLRAEPQRPCGPTGIEVGRPHRVWINKVGAEDFVQFRFANHCCFSIAATYLTGATSPMIRFVFAARGVEQPGTCCFA